MTGAAALAAGAAQRTGSGMVVASSPGVDDAVLAGRFPAEVVTRPLAHVDWSADVLSDIDRFGSLVIGPGLGRQAATVDAAVRTIALAELPTVVDGDGLYAIAGDDTGGAAVLRERTAATVLTPTRASSRSSAGRRRARIGWPTSPARRHDGIGRAPQGPDDDRRRTRRAPPTSSSTAMPASPPPAPATCWPASSARCWRWERRRSRRPPGVRGSTPAPVPRWHRSDWSPVI